MRLIGRPWVIERKDQRGMIATGINRFGCDGAPRHQGSKASQEVVDELPGQDTVKRERSNTARETTTPTVAHYGVEEPEEQFRESRREECLENQGKLCLRSRPARRLSRR